MLKRRPTLKKYIRREDHPPLIYFYSNIEYVAVENDGLVFSLEKRDKK